MAIGSDSPRFQQNTNAQLVASFNARTDSRQLAAKVAPVNRETVRLMTLNRADFLR